MKAAGQQPSFWTCIAIIVGVFIQTMCEREEISGLKIYMYTVVFCWLLSFGSINIRMLIWNQLAFLQICLCLLFIQFYLYLLICQSRITVYVKKKNISILNQAMALNMIALVSISVHYVCIQYIYIQ